MAGRASGTWTVAAAAPDVSEKIEAVVGRDTGVAVDAVVAFVVAGDGRDGGIGSEACVAADGEKRLSAGPEDMALGTGSGSRSGQNSEHQLPFHLSRGSD